MTCLFVVPWVSLNLVVLADEYDLGWYCFPLEKDERKMRRSGEKKTQHWNLEQELVWNRPSGWVGWNCVVDGRFADVSAARLRCLI
jgi:hypothetical protein